MWNIKDIEHDELIQFLKNEKFYDSPFNIKDDQIKIIHDGDLATYFATDDSEEFFQDWQSLWENQIVNLNIYGNSNILSKINHFLEEELNYSKDFCGAIKKVGYDAGTEISLLFNNMEGDMLKLLLCVAHNKTSPFIEKMRLIYLNNGFPCGYEGSYPNGKFVVFSNK